MEKRAIHSVLLDSIKEIIEIKLQNGELLRISGEMLPGDEYSWTLTHIPQKVQRYFRDIDSSDINEILSKVDEYPVESIQIRNGPVIYSKSKLVNRMKQVRSSFGKSTLKVVKDILYLKK